MKKYNQFIKESSNRFLANLSDDDLQDKLDTLRLEFQEIQDEIGMIVNIQKDRKNKENTEYAKTLPASIYDFNDEQLEFIFQGDPRSDKQYEIQQQYYRQLQGVFPSMTYDPNTKQKIFSIVTSRCVNEEEDKYDEEEAKIAVKDIKFLANKLKKSNNEQFGEFVMFNVLYSHSENYNDVVIYKTNGEIMLCNSVRASYLILKKFTNVEDLLKHLVENDLDNKDRDSWEY